jgi:N-acetyl-alpha-D-muramate 1-phosphate uridylyltransferase
MDRGLVTGEVYAGDWADVGTPERLAQLNASEDLNLAPPH